MGLGWKKSTRLTLAAVGMFAVTLFAFQNCAPEQYFRAVELEDQSSTGGPGPGPSPAPSGNRYFITVGELKGTDAARAAALTVSGRMMMVRDSLTGSTESFIHAIGLPAAQPGTVHVHDLPCSVNGGGGHYKLDYAEAGVVASNEIWPIIPVTDALGIGSGYARVNKHYARPEAQSMVVHDPITPTTRLGCGLLHSTWGSSIVGGSFAPLAAGAALPNARGSAAIARLGTDGLTVVRASIAGLAPGTTYNAHVHNRPCAAPDFGGAHYLQNPDVIETVATANNEIWMQFNTTPAVNGTGGGYAITRVQVPHVARNDAVSIVIHDPVTPATRLFCVDLTQPVGFIRTEAGLTRYPTLNGAAKMERLATGETKITVSNVVGLTPNANYVLHVHDRPCHISGGGGHYKHDYGIADVIESNEVWVRLATDIQGSASGVTLSKHILRPEAYSVVLHDLDAGGTRLACADLYQ